MSSSFQNYNWTFLQDASITGKTRCSMDEIIHTSHTATAMALNEFNICYRNVQKNIERIYRDVQANQHVWDLETDSDYYAHATDEPIEDEAMTESDEENVRAVISDFASHMRQILTELKELRKTENEKFEEIQTKMFGLHKLCTRERSNIFHVYRLIAEFLLRRGYYDAGSRLIEKLGLVDEFSLNLFKNMTLIRDALLQGNINLFTEWTEHNSKKLKTFSNYLDSMVHLRNIHDRLMHAPYDFTQSRFCLQYIRDQTHVNGLNLDASMQLQSIMLMFATPPELFPSQTNSVNNEECYCRILTWESLAEEFMSCYKSIHNMGIKDPFESVLEAGLIVSRTWDCGSTKENTLLTMNKCPTCHPFLLDLSKRIPMPLRKNSVIRCRLTGDLINEQNPGIMLPNGQVFGRRAVDSLEDVNGKIICPVTKTQFNRKDLRRIFIV